MNPLRSQQAQPDARPLQILKNGDRPCPPVGRLPDQIDGLGMFVERAVLEVQPRHVHSAVEQLLQAVERAARRTDRADDFGFSHEIEEPA